MYLGEVSVKLQKTLFERLSKFYPDKVFRITPVNTFRIGSFFHFKDVLPTTLCSSIVYSFTCSSCQAGYVGCTLRSLKTRFSEHVGQSVRTGRPIHNPPFSAIREHSEICKCGVSFSDFSILSHCNNRSDLKILESLYIHKLKPSLNNTVSSHPLYVV